MLNQLRGRNLAHVGCTIGLTLGLFIGMLIAIGVLQFAQSDSAASWAGLVWIAAALALGALGYVVGARSSQRIERSEGGERRED